MGMIGRTGSRSRMPSVVVRGAVAGAVLALTLGALRASAVGGVGSQAPASPALSRAEAIRRADALAAIGRRMFADPSLSASGQQSCASCHSPAHAFGPPDDEAVRQGGAALDRPGVRAVPSLRYLQVAPAFVEHYFESEDDGDESVDAGPTGGLTWDGRVDRGRDQARIPLLSPFEMANASEAAVVDAVSRAAYAGDLRALFGDDVFTRPERAFVAIGEALEAYQQTPDEFYPYTSKYDAVLRGEATLTPRERRGLALFEDPDKGNCARCHFSRPGRNGTLPQFTDFSLVAIGAPRNWAIAANADPDYYDLGMCGPLRTDLTDRSEYCGRFMTPTLRNTATREVFFHNGAFHRLRDVVAFYAERDTNPEKWYSRGPDGRVRAFDDLPERYRDNLDMDPPFGGHPGDRPVLTSSEIDDIVAFIETLTDGYEARRRPIAAAAPATGYRPRATRDHTPPKPQASSLKPQAPGPKPSTFAKATVDK
jgi:cytochrome c peroxidase